MSAREKLEGQITFNEENNLLDIMGADKDWEKEWSGMPEFLMGSTEPVQKITVSFATFEDVRKFSELLEQNLTKKTKSLWFPRQDKYLSPKNFRYVSDES
tara:strand:- start:2143 stop:2442 length:300 start_codon:yes stop_codon:yes gene_type:complete